MGINRSSQKAGFDDRTGNRRALWPWPAKLGEAGLKNCAPHPQGAAAMGRPGAAPRPFFSTGRQPARIGAGDRRPWKLLRRNRETHRMSDRQVNRHECPYAGRAFGKIGVRVAGQGNGAPITYQ